jgi:hypothetical protein
MSVSKTASVFIFVLYLQTISFAQTSFWTDSSVPVTPATADTASVTLGLRFSSEVSGTVTGIRFYKGPRNTGTHVGNLWSSTGTKLATVTFSAETASGWQHASFSSPVNIAANTTYVISYLAPKGHYANDINYAWSSLNAAPLHTSGSSPGVYAYGTSATFPTASWNESNYWVDPIFVAASSPTTAFSSFWTDSRIPGTPAVTNDTASVTLGLKFYSDVPGSASGVRFYKGPNNNGIHVGTLWSGTGTKLAEITFSGETASGWQQANFSSPVNIAANTIYVISYLAPKGYYACDQNYSWATLSAAPLHVSGAAPGVFTYGAASTFPSGTWNGSNYWVDLVFSPGSSSNPPALYTISGSVSGSAATLTLSGAATASTTTDATGKYMFSSLANGSYVVAASQSGYTFTPSTVSVPINGSPVTGVNFAAASVPVAHSVTLNWTASTSNIVGYNVYRGNVSGGPYAQIGFTGGTAYVDTNVSSGQTYYYVATAVDGSNIESAYSTQASAVIPTP